MLLFHTALMSEARSLIERYGLKAQRLDSGFRLFLSRETALVVSGVGRVRAGAAVAYVVAHLRENVRVAPFVLNFGVCGTADPGKSPGATYLVGKCTAVATRRAFYPDILFNHSLPEAVLHSFDEIVDSRRMALDAAPDVDLVDMEAAGIFEAVSLLMSPSRVMSIKVVGDSLDDAWNVSAAEVDARMRAAAPAVEELVETYRAFANRSDDADFLGEGNEEVLGKVRENLRLTQAQRDLLNDAALYHLASGGDSLEEVIRPFQNQAPQHKRERTVVFRELIDALHGK